MSDYPNHPIAECYPPPTAKDYEDLKEHIRANKLQNPIVLFEGKILCGIQRARICRELGIEPTYVTPKIDDPIAYAIGDNEKRRHWSKSQLAVIGEKLASLRRGSNRYQKKVDPSKNGSTFPSVAQTAKDLGISQTQIEKVRYAKTKGIPELIDAIEDNKITEYDAATIAHLPKEEQPTALKGVLAKRASKGFRQSSKKSQSAKLQWTPEEAAKDKACLEALNAPSTFPEDALISQSTNLSETRLRRAINWLREHEGKIAFFKRADLHLLLMNTNAVQAYKVNYPGFARPDGELDQRVLDWCQDLWRRRLRQEERLDLAAKLRPPRAEKPIERKAKRSFEDRFKTFWMLIDDNLGRLFKPNECGRLIKTFSQEARQFFSELSAKNMGPAVVADSSEKQVI